MEPKTVKTGKTESMKILADLIRI